jgi:hypothetical protein
MGTKLAVALAAAVLAPSAPAALAGAPASLGVVHGETVSSLVRLDRDTLRPLAPRLRLPGWSQAWARSPDASRLAYASSHVPATGRPARLRIVDLDAWRIERVVPLPVPAGRPVGVAWLGGRILVVLSRLGGNRVVAVDPGTGRLGRAAGVGGRIILGAATRDRLVLLVGAYGRIAPVRLVTVDDRLHVRSVRLGRVLAGTTYPDPNSGSVSTRIPGLAVSPSGRTAVVLGAGDPGARVDLATLDVVYGDVRLVARSVKTTDGPMRVATWLRGDTVVVGGVDTRATGAEIEERPAGIVLLNVKTWRARVLAPGFAWPVVASGAVLATGRSEQSALDAWRGDGVLVRSPDGRVTRMLSGRAAWVQAIGDRALVTIHGPRPLARVIDVPGARVVATLRSRLTLLAGRAGPLPS